GAIRDIIGTCRQLGITCSICGQAPSDSPELTEKLVEWGIDSISVNPDVIERTRRVIAAAEQRVLLEGMRRGAGLAGRSCPVAGHSPANDGLEQDQRQTTTRRCIE